MKRIYFLLFIALLSIISLTARAAITQLASGNITTAVATAASGDIIELTTSGGAYTWTLAANSGSISVANLTIRAASGLVARPVVTVVNSWGYNWFINITTATNFTMSGIEVDGANASTYFIYNSAGTGDVTANFDNCKFYGIKNSTSTSFLKMGAQPTTFALNLTNSVFLLNNNSIYSDPAWSGNCPTTLSATNCLFSGTSSSAGTFGFLGAPWVPLTFSINHCTFTGNTGQKDFVLGQKTGGSVPVVTNSLFINSGASSTMGGVDFNVSNIGVYPAGNTSYYSTAGANTLTVNPALDGNGYATALAYTSAGTDGKNIGYYNPNAAPVVVPTLSASSSMTAFSYAFGAGPSTEKSFTISGTNLTGDITLTPPSNYEITTTSGSGYVSSPSTITLTQSGGNVASTTIYVRLKSGLSANTYSANIVAVSSGATSSNIAVTGTVTPPAGVVQLAAGADVAGAVKNALSGDIIELTTDGGAYTWKASVNVLISQANITIRAAAGLANRPIITVINNYADNYCFNISAATNLSLQGVEIKNSATDAYNFFITTSTTGNVTVNIDNCKFSNIKSGKDIFHPSSQPAVFTLNITNSIFAISNNSLLYLDTNVGNHVTDLNINNTLFTGTSMATGTIAFLGWGNSFQPNSITLNHCTFTGNTGQADLVQVTTKTSGATATITNCLFQGSGAASSIGSVSLDNVTTGVYPAGNKSYFSTSGASTLTVDPAFDANGYATAASYVGAGTDGKTIGYYGVLGLITTVSKLYSDNYVMIYQNNSCFKVLGAKENAIFSIISLTGSQLATGIIINNSFDLHLNKGIYIFKSNNQVTKFSVK